jgi:hypothetical protein
MPELPSVCNNPDRLGDLADTDRHLVGGCISLRVIPDLVPPEGRRLDNQTVV